MSNVHNHSTTRKTLTELSHYLSKMEKSNPLQDRSSAQEPRVIPTTEEFTMPGKTIARQSDIPKSGVSSITLQPGVKRRRGSEASLASCSDSDAGSIEEIPFTSKPPSPVPTASTNPEPALKKPRLETHSIPQKPALNNHRTPYVEEGSETPTPRASTYTTSVAKQDSVRDFDIFDLPSSDDEDASVRRNISKKPKALPRELPPVASNLTIDRVTAGGESLFDSCTSRVSNETQKLVRQKVT